jgi:hypothetical protein
MSEKKSRTTIPAPREKLAGCIWLPRILAKARLLQCGELPPEFAERFCHPTGVDMQFLTHLGLTKEDILAAAALPDSEIPAWLQSHVSSERIENWNHVAVNLGRPGFPMTERLPIALATTYKHIDPQGITTVFEVLEADDKLL